jgi:hypothetical protein
LDGSSSVEHPTHAGAEPVSAARRITAIDVIADPDRRRLRLAVLPG